MDNNEAIMDLGIDNFNEDEVELNMFSAEDSAKPVPYVTNNKVPPIPRKCIRKGDLVCYVKNENINMINNNTQRSATPTYSVNSDSKTRSSSETDNILSGESLYKTFIFEESLNDNDTQKCIAFWKSVMEKNLTPIKCTIIENKKKRARELKVEQEKKSSIIENRDDIIKEATDKVHAEYKAMWMAALKEIKRKKLDKVKLVGQARCKLCETIENPMEEYSTDIDSVTIKEEVKGLNQWESVSKRPKRGEIRGGEELVRKLKQKERQQTQYKFVNVIEEKKKSGTYKLWRSNMVKPPCSCGKKNCECNINPAIICMRTPLTSMMAKPSKPVAEIKTSKKEISQKSSARSSVSEKGSAKEQLSQPIDKTRKQSVEEKTSHKEQLSPSADKTRKPSVEEKRSYKEPFVEKIPHAEIPPKISTEEKMHYKEETPKTSIDERKSAPQPSLAQKPKDEILSRPSEPTQKYLPEASSQTPTDQDSQTDKGVLSKVLPFQPVADHVADHVADLVSDSNLTDIAEDVSGILVTRATPFIMELADTIYREISTMSTLPYADASTFLKMPSEEFLAEVSQLVLARARDLMENLSENLIQEISQIIVGKAKPMFEMMASRRATVEEVEVEEKDTVYNDGVMHELLHQPVVYPDSIPLTSSMRKVTSDISPEPSMERQVSILLPTGEVEVTKDRSVDMVGMNTSWDKPVVNPNKIPAVRKGSLEVIKARKQLKKKSDHAMDKPPSLVPVVSATVDSEVQTDFNISILHQGKDKPIVDHGADQSKSSDKNHAIETQHVSHPKAHQISLVIDKEQVSKHKSDMGEQDVPDKDKDKSSIKSEFDEPIPHKLPRDSLFVTKERVARHKKDMEEKDMEENYSEEEMDPEAIHRQIRLLSEITSTSNTKKIDSKNLRDSIFVNKERVSKHKSDMAEEMDIESQQTDTTVSLAGEIEIRTINSRTLRDSIFVNKERVSKHKQEMSEESLGDGDDVDSEKRQIRISEPIGTKKKKSRTLKDSMTHKKYGTYDESHKSEVKARQVRLTSSPIEIKTHKQIHIDSSSTKDSLPVKKEVVGKTNPRMIQKIRIASETTETQINKRRTNPMIIKDSIYVTKERVAKHKKEMGETHVNDIEEPEVENQNRLIHILPEPKEGDIHIKRTNPTLTKNSIPLQKEHVSKGKQKEKSIIDEEATVDNRQIHISELKEEDIHIKRANPMRIKDSVFVTKERVAKHKKDVGEENEKVEVKNRQIRIISTPTDAEIKRKRMGSKDSSSIQKGRTDKRGTDTDIEGKNRQTHDNVNDTETKNRLVPELSEPAEPEIHKLDEIVESVTVDVEESKMYPLDVPGSSNVIDLTTLLNANQIADSIIVTKGKLEKTHQRMFRSKPTKTKDYHPVNKQKFTKRGKRNENLLSQVLYETDYEKIKEKDPIGNTESIRNNTCDPCYCIKCPVLKITRTSGKGRKKVYSCPLNAGNKKEKKKKCHSTGIIIQELSSAISKPQSADGPSSLKQLLSGVSAEESKFTEF